MVRDRLEMEMEAMAAYQRAVAAIRECQVAYENAGLPVPERVRRFVENAAAKPSEKAASANAPPAPPSPPLPSGWSPSWTWLPTERALPTSLTLAILRGAGQALRHGEIVTAVSDLRGEEQNPRVLSNLAARLEEQGLLSRDENGWALVRPERAPVLHARHLWGPPDVFDKHEIAEHRRIGIEHLLRIHPEGLQVMQLTRMLERSDWIRAPHSKDLVKTDLHRLDKEGRAKRVGNSGKWRATTSE